MAVNKVIYAGETLVDLTGVTVTPETLAEGATALDASGELIVGTMTGDDLNAVLAEQEQLIAELQETLRNKTAGEGGGEDDAPKYVKIFARPESTTAFTIVNPLGGIAKQVLVYRVSTTETENRKIQKYIADRDYGIGVVELISTSGTVRYPVTKAEDDTPGNSQFAMSNGVIKLQRHSSANTWDTESEYEVEIYQSDSDNSDVLSIIKEKVNGYDIITGEV